MRHFFIALVFTYFQFFTIHSFENKFDIKFDPPLVRGLSQWQTINISFEINHNFSEAIDEEFELILDTIEKPEYPRHVLEFIGDNTYRFKISESVPTFSSKFQLKALFLGYSNITFKLMQNKSLVQTLDDFSVSVVRKSSIFDTIFGIIIISLITINYINMGCHLDLNIVLKTLKTPTGPLIGFICQFSIMPLASYLIGWLMLEDISLRLGLFTLGCSPGGNSSNFWTLLFNGDVNLSITMTFISTIAALVMMPLWLFTLGQTLFTTANIRIPYLNLFSSLITLTFPMVIGIAIQHFRPNWAKISHKIIKPFTIVVVIIAIVGSSVLYSHIFLMFTWPVVIAGALVAISGYSLGAIISGLCGMKREQIIAISIETAYQNGGIAFILLLLTLQQPDADIASVPCIAQLLITGQPLWLVFIGIKIWKYFNPKTDKNISIDNEIEKTNENNFKNISLNGLETACYDGPYGAKQVKESDLKSSETQITKF